MDGGDGVAETDVTWGTWVIYYNNRGRNIKGMCMGTAENLGVQPLTQDNLH